MSERIKRRLIDNDKKGLFTLIVVCKKKMGLSKMAVVSIEYGTEVGSVFILLLRIAKEKSFKNIKA
jgi:hypothetical protein